MAGRQHDGDLISAAEMLARAADLQKAAALKLQATMRRYEVGAVAGAPDVPLTPREREVLRLLGQGWSNRRISRALGISEHTVRAHLQAIFRKLGAEQRTEAVVIAARAGLLGAMEPPVTR